MKGKSFEYLRYTVTEEQREQRMLEIGRTKTFLYFLEEKTIDEQRCLLTEINKIMEEGIPFTEFLLIGMEYRNMVGESDYRKIAIFCFAETLNEVISQNRDRTRNLEETPYFLETYNKVFEEIIDYLSQERPDFPEESLRCLFLLTDEDIDYHRQGLTASKLILECLPYCSNDQQAEDIEQQIKACMR